MSEDIRKLSSLERVEEAARDLGIDIAVKRMEQSTRTAEEAAAHPIGGADSVWEIELHLRVANS